MDIRTAKQVYRAYPTVEQAHFLAGAFGMARVIYNDYLYQKELLFKAGFTGRPRSLETKSPPVGYEWLKTYSNKLREQARRDAETAYTNYFKGLNGTYASKPGKPRFKKKRAGGNLRWNGVNTLAVKKLGRKWAAVRIPKEGSWLRFRLSRDLLSTPTGVTLKLSPSGEYTVTFTVKQEIAPAKTNGTVAGVDLGLIELATVAKDDGSRYKATAEKHYRRNESKLARLQREYSRKEPGSKNQEKARLAVARQHARVARTRLDQARKVAFKLASENQAIGLEDLNLAGMVKTRLGKSVTDAGLGQLVRTIESTSQRLGTAVYRCGRWDPTSQVCSACGALDGKKPLSVRSWVCKECGTHLDRDYNAALNVLLLAVGQTENLNASRDSVRRKLASAAVCEGGTPAFQPYRYRKRKQRKVSLVRRAKLTSS